jgi:hypothetical protein
VRMMKKLSIAFLLAVIALSGVGTSWAFNDDTPVTGPDAIQAPERRRRWGASPPTCRRTITAFVPAASDVQSLFGDPLS